MRKLSKIRSSANSLYDFYKYPTDLIPYKNGFNITEGIHDMTCEENWFYFLDMICFHKKRFKKEIWQFSRENDNVFTLTGNSERNVQFTEIPDLESDFFFDDFTLVKKEKLICLPVEEDIY